MFAGELVGDGGDARTVNTDAGTHRVNTLVAAHHRDLGAHAGITGRRLDFHDAFFDFRHFELKEFVQKLRAGTRQNHLTALGVFFDLEHKGTHAVTVTEVFARNHFAAGQKRFKAADFNNGAVLHHALDLAVDDLLVAGEEFLEDLFAFGVPQTLQNDLLGVLGKAAAGAVDVFNRLFDVVAHLDLRIVVDHVGEHLLAVGLLQAFVAAHHNPAALGGPVTGAAVNAHHHIGVFTRELRLFHGACQSRFKHAEHGRLFNILFVGQYIDHLEHISAHYFFPLKSSSAIRLARSTSTRSNSTTTGAATGVFAAFFLSRTACEGVRAI